MPELAGSCGRSSYSSKSAPPQTRKSSPPEWSSRITLPGYSSQVYSPSPTAIRCLQSSHVLISLIVFTSLSNPRPQELPNRSADQQHGQRNSNRCHAYIQPPDIHGQVIGPGSQPPGGSSYLRSAAMPLNLSLHFLLPSSLSNGPRLRRSPPNCMLFWPSPALRVTRAAPV